MMKNAIRIPLFLTASALLRKKSKLQLLRNQQPASPEGQRSSEVEAEEDEAGEDDHQCRGGGRQKSVPKRRLQPIVVIERDQEEMQMKMKSWMSAAQKQMLTRYTTTACFQKSEGELN
jgi:hypothetical protein